VKNGELGLRPNWLLKLLRQDCRLAPADDLERSEAVMVNHAKVALSVLEDGVR